RGFDLPPAVLLCPKGYRSLIAGPVLRIWISLRRLAGSAAPPAPRRRNCRRGSFISDLPLWSPYNGAAVQRLAVAHALDPSCGRALPGALVARAPRVATRLPPRRRAA